MSASTDLASLATALLASEPDIVSFCRRVRTAGEQFGVDGQGALGLSSATYELAQVLRERGMEVRAELGIRSGPRLEVKIDVTGPSSLQEILASLVAPLRPMVPDLTTSHDDSTWSVQLAVPLQEISLDREMAARPVSRAAGAPAASAGNRDPATLLRTIDDLQAELHETNRGVVALYAELDDRAERLREAEDRLRLLLDSVQDYGIYMLTPGGNVASWNAGAERLFGFTAEEIMGRHVSSFYPSADREAGLPEQHLRQAAEEGRSESEGLRMRNGGATFDANVLITPVRSQSGELRGFSAVVRDVTERKRLEDDLRRRADELADANRAKEDFLATLSHELRTPLNAMLGWTRLLQSGRLDSNAVGRALETIERNARLQEQLIADILDVSRIVTGKLRLNVRPLQLAPVVAAAVDALRPAADAKQLHLETSFRFTGKVLGDPDRLQQVVWNLLSNAIKFTPPEGFVRVSVERAGGAATVAVADTGEGIPADLLPYVFDRFRQGDASVTRSHGGLGLGLAIVRHIVELHGGKVQAFSGGPGCGATLSVHLPIRTVARRRAARRQRRS